MGCPRSRRCRLHHPRLPLLVSSSLTNAHSPTLTNTAATTAVAAAVAEWHQCTEPVGWVEIGPANLLQDNNTVLDKAHTIRMSLTMAASQLLLTPLRSRTKRRERRSIVMMAIMDRIHMDSRVMNCSNRRAAINLNGVEIRCMTHPKDRRRRRAMV